MAGGFGQMILPALLAQKPTIRASILAVDGDKVFAGSRQRLWKYTD